MNYTGAVAPLERTLRRSFVADHFHDRPGFQEARHGHNWTVEATVEDPEGGEAAFAGALDAWVQSLDYALLNDAPLLARRNPTAELLAQRAFEALAAEGLAPRRVKVTEKPNYWAACEARS
ncbi:MAG: 6-carboxytetrahydropterin synthase [Acidobacteria bacterium]|nr:6-carboxytetrahydropterin synthase [Acidobacteriota bacterium]